jgi:hypothetical protein
VAGPRERRDEQTWIADPLAATVLRQLAPMDCQDDIIPDPDRLLH